MARPAQTRRDELYERLREAGGRGVEQQHTFGLNGHHLLSLIAEGHHVETIPDPDRPLGYRTVLRKDAWA